MTAHSASPESLREALEQVGQIAEWIATDIEAQTHGVGTTRAEWRKAANEIIDTIEAALQRDSAAPEGLRAALDRLPWNASGYIVITRTELEAALAAPPEPPALDVEDLGLSVPLDADRLARLEHIEAAADRLCRLAETGWTGDSEQAAWRGLREALG